MTFSVTASCNLASPIDGQPIVDGYPGLPGKPELSLDARREPFADQSLIRDASPSGDLPKGLDLHGSRRERLPRKISSARRS